jgi:hypothetical protein
LLGRYALKAVHVELPFLLLVLSVIASDDAELGTILYAYEQHEFQDRRKVAPMIDYVTRILATAAKRTSAGYVLALIYCLLAALIWNRPLGHVQAATSPWTTDSTIAGLYFLTNAARVFTYVPQLMAVWRSTDGARDISLLTWGSWVVANATAVTYGAFVIHDLFFTLIAVLNLVCCAAVTVVGVQRRKAQRQVSP